MTFCKFRRPDGTTLALPKGYAGPLVLLERPDGITEVRWGGFAMPICGSALSIIAETAYNERVRDTKYAAFHSPIAGMPVFVHVPSVTMIEGEPCAVGIDVGGIRVLVRESLDEVIAALAP